MLHLARPLRCAALGALLFVPAFAQDDAIHELEAAREGSQWVLRDQDRTLLHMSSSELEDARLIDITDDTRVLTWEEADVSHYRLEIDGRPWSRVRSTSHVVRLVHGDFDPLVSPPDFSESQLPDGGELMIVQFVAPPLQAFRDDIENLGGTVYHFLADHSHIVRMDEMTAEAVEKLPYVRWVGEYHAEYRLEREILSGLVDGTLDESGIYNVQVMEKGPVQKNVVAARIEQIGGTIETAYPDGYLIRAVLSPAQITQIVTWDEVLWLDRWGAPSTDMNNVRIDGGANYVEANTGFTGQGVHGEVMDGGVRLSHVDFQNPPIIMHGGQSGSTDHGTKTTGIVFADGTGNSMGRGMLPDGQPVFADYGLLGNRYTHTAQLMQAPYFCVFQSNSWGNAQTTQYNSISMQMDDILFDFDLVILNSQSNTGNQNSRPQAWAKNIVGVGGIRHFDTLNTNNDSWGNSASIGPAADGRLKPDLCYWYDSIFTTDDDSNTDYTTSFGGTSASTPETAGHMGIVYQMWHMGIFGNTPTGNTVFESRPKATLARALLINTANQYPFSGTGHDLTRTHQGWGRPSVGNLYDLKDDLFYVNEDVVLSQGQNISYPLGVDLNTPELKVTMIYLDPAGTTSSSQHRINDLSLKVTSPTGTVYWGNNGLAANNYSTPNGVSNVKDPVENVFVLNPASGTWIVEVFADEINQDSHVETPQIDADFALVASGVTTSGTPCVAPISYCPGAPNSASSGAVLSTLGTPSISLNNIVFEMFGVPAHENGIVFYGTTTDNVPLGDGTRCVGGSLFRLLPPVTSNLFGYASFNLDVTNPPTMGQVAAGETWYYQFYYRDGQSSNLSNALEIMWCD